MQLPDDYDIDTHFTPHYDPWDQRLCADPDGTVLQGHQAGRRVGGHRPRSTPSPRPACSSSRATQLDADIVVTATGLELLFMGGIDISVDGEPVDLAQKLTYKGMMLEGVPNLAMAVGYTNASWTLKCDLTCDYVARLLNEMRQRGRAQATPRNRDGSVSPEPLLGLTAGLRPAVGTPVSPAGQRGAVAGPPELPPRLPGPEDGRRRRRRDGADQPPTAVRPTTDRRRGSGRHGRLTESRGSSDMQIFAGRVAAITGAGSGIGRALAQELAGRGAHLALADIDPVGMAETVAMCEGAGVKVTTCELDVADRDAVFAWADRVVDEHGKVEPHLQQRRRRAGGHGRRGRLRTTSSG